MNALFAAGLFDSPWVLAVIVIVGALSNWLSKRRQEKQAGHPPEGDEPAPSSGTAPGEFNLEETIRRLMGEEPPQAPAPPLIPRTAPVLRPPIASAQVGVTLRAASKSEEQAARRFEQLNEQGRHPATVVGRTRQRPSRSGLRGASRWRDSRSVRRAFVASLVFAPPKSFEP